MSGPNGKGQEGAGNLRLHQIDKGMLEEALFALGSEGFLQGSIHEKTGIPIDSEAIRERVAEVMTLIETELRMFENAQAKTEI
ncbi:hypothetical protein [Pelagimonas varians]|uniref:Uncharacterized protein n=1 Tax=Pelagimonas varians TaxID=696760 RepID=A0A238K703_9RHOB|nr:hypothetical protein [Pelagimonas varians]PYG31737.1 hypothetical protein C8N36_104157 [Pelagimonas varians]SMX38680.1 hypothetical protein PEV8663_01487 [Pelagimonas varians]